jgi:hypothetical protein
MANLTLRFNGHDGSLGLRNGKLYTIIFRKGHIAQIFEGHGVSYTHITDCPYDSLNAFFENWQHPMEGTLRETIEEQDKELRELREWKADIEESHKATMAEPCESDLLHCTCVPDLRREIARLTEQLTAAQNEARELRALMLKCHNVNTLYDETNDFDIYRPMPYASETLIGIIAQARAEREARNDFDESSDAVTGVGDR